MKIKKYIIFLIVIAIFVIAVFFLNKKAQAPMDGSQNVVNNAQQLVTSDQSSVINDQKSTDNIVNVKSQTTSPIDDALARITKKTFGLLIAPKTSPVQPERFSGYHTGVDLETTPEEQNIDVGVKALCDGKLLMARSAGGYGGVIVESCNLDGEKVTVVYGHINLASVSMRVGDNLKAGDFLANLGKGFSDQTDGERKHLHLGIHRGIEINILGYVQKKSELVKWLDPVKYLQ
jgi:hypothetical protein